MDVWRLLAWGAVVAAGTVLFLAMVGNAVQNAQRRIEGLIAEQKFRLEQRRRTEEAAREAANVGPG
ncbi:MAG: hypothetical protein AABZ47_14295 [Planctomycetota bacterium]